MKFLILSANTGGGHNSAAYAIRDKFTAEGHQCDIKDCLAFVSKGTSKIVSGGHIFIYKHAPLFFGLVYGSAERFAAKSGKHSLIYRALKLGAKRLKTFVEGGNYDGIFCTHVFSGQIASSAIKEYGLPQKVYFVATDYTCSPGVSEMDCDIYFIPHFELCDDFISKHVPPEKIVPSGIPVRADFYGSVPKEQAKKELGLPDKKIVLLMCGSMGCGPLKKLAELLCEKLPDDCHLVAICGNNKRLKSKLRACLNDGKSTIVGFTDRMYLYMDAAEIGITKPGGLSTAESIAKALPLVLINAVPGCETYNLTFLTENEFGFTSRKVEDLTQLVCDTVQSPIKLEEISNRLKTHCERNPSQKIYDAVMQQNQNRPS